MGKTVQIIPHITDEIKRNILLLGQKMKYDFVITEIGGVAGDIESLPFLESVRQLKWELGGDCINVHLTYVPYLAAAKELKTKPTQHSVKKLQELGIQPDVLVLRTEHDINEDMRKKVSLFCNVSPEAVIQCKDAPCIYEVPLRMQKQGLDAVILKKLGIAPEATTSDLTKWNNFLDKKQNATEEVKIALVGKYVELQDAYKSISESLLQAAVYNNRVLKLISIQSENLTKENIAENLQGMDGVLVAPGSGPRGVEGKIVALEYCRKNNIPTLGIVLGMQCMAIEFARNVLGLLDANSTEMDSKTKNNVIDLIESQTVVSSEDGYIRSGAYDCELLADSKAAAIYGKTQISERHRNRYEFNNSYKEAFEKAGMRITGVNPETGLAEILEIPSLKWYIGVQFHPQYRSSIEKPHPLFVNFVKAAIDK